MKSKSSRNSVNKETSTLLLLKKKKFTEKMLEKTDRELMTIENLIMDIEYKNVEQNVLKGIEVGNEALKQLNSLFSIDKIEALLEETEEGIQKQKEINELITGIKEIDEIAMDDDELNEELENILDDQTIELPEVPSEQPVTNDTDIKAKKTKIKEKKILVEAQ
ncbi:hypothetical protein SSS_05011 [Sarcoptes scabiei]|nr:hypothetical protein SSS_05011 [Sarcoptes scabiei]